MTDPKMERRIIELESSVSNQAVAINVLLGRISMLEKLIAATEPPTDGWVAMTYADMVEQ